MTTEQKLEKELNDLKEKYKNSESEIDFEYEQLLSYEFIKFNQKGSLR